MSLSERKFRSSENVVTIEIYSPIGSEDALEEISLSTSKDLDCYLKKLKLKDQKVALTESHIDFLRSKLAGVDACPADLIFSTCVRSNNLEYLTQILPKNGIYTLVCVDKGL